MSELFYRFSFFCALLSLVFVACSDSKSSQSDLSSLEVVFANTKSMPLFKKVNSEEQAARFLENLDFGTKNGRRFASEQLLRMPSLSLPLCRNFLSDITRTSKSTGFLMSVLQIMHDIGQPEDFPLVIPFVGLKHPPVVRTAAYETLGQIALPEHGGFLLNSVSSENEEAPRVAGLVALARSGSLEGHNYLHEQVVKWHDTQDAGLESAWNALLLSTSPALLASLEELEPRLAPFLALQAYGVRIQLGDRDLADKIKKYLNSEKYPSAGTRELAVQLLGELGESQAFLDLVPAGNEKIDLAIINLLGREDMQGVGQSELDLYTQQDSEGLRRAALTVLIKRGYFGYLDSYLLSLKEYPFGSNSLLALKMVTDMPSLPSHAVNILTSRWNSCQEPTHFYSLIRALVRAGNSSANNFLGQLLVSEDSPSFIVENIAEVIGNCGPESVPWLIKYWEQNPTYERAERSFLALGRYADYPGVSELMWSIAGDSNQLPATRRLLFENLHKIYPNDYVEKMLEIYGREESALVRNFISTMLWEYY